MVFNRGVISSLNNDSSDMLGASRIALKLADEQAIVSGSLLTVESNHFAVVKMRGAVLNVYETGQYSLTTQDKPIIGSIGAGAKRHGSMKLSTLTDQSFLFV
jgi:membrane protease subunit (stomatin/prohibitin family)